MADIKEIVKKLYRECSLVVHPDKVGESKKAQATITFTKIKDFKDFIVDYKNKAPDLSEREFERRVSFLLTFAQSAEGKIQHINDIEKREYVDHIAKVKLFHKDNFKSNGVIATKEELEILLGMNVAAYEGKASTNKEYELVASRDGNNYYGSAHVNVNKKQLIFTHRGADSVTPLFNNDKNNYEFISGGFKAASFSGYGDCSQCSIANNFVSAVLKNTTYDDYSITFTGHSFGAQLAAVTQVALEQENPLRDIKGVGFADPGSKEFIEAIAKNRNKPVIEPAYLSINLSGDKLRNANNQLGLEWFINSIDRGCPHIWIRAICSYAGNNHMLINVKNAVDTFSEQQVLQALSHSSIIRKLAKLEEGKLMEVAAILLDGIEFSIKLQKIVSGSAGGIAIDLRTNTIEIKTSKVPAEDKQLKQVINGIKIGWEKGKPALDKNGKAIQCLDDSSLSEKPINCLPISKQNNIIFKLGQLFVSSLDSESTMTVAKIIVNGRTCLVQYKKANADAAATLTKNKNVDTILVARQQMPDSNDSLKEDIKRIKMTVSSSGVLALDSAGTLTIDCSSVDFSSFNQAISTLAPDCTITATNAPTGNGAPTSAPPTGSPTSGPSGGSPTSGPTSGAPIKIQDIIASLENPNNANVKVLEDNMPHLQAKHTEADIHAAAPFIVLNHLEVSADQADKIIESHREFTDHSVPIGSVRAEELLDCLEFGIC